MERIDFSCGENQLAAICNPEWHHALCKLKYLRPTILEVKSILRIFRRGALRTSTWEAERLLYERMHNKLFALWRNDKISTDIFFYCLIQMQCAEVEAGFWKSDQQIAFGRKASRAYNINRRRIRE